MPSIVSRGHQVTPPEKWWSRKSQSIWKGGRDLVPYACAAWLLE
ncbi:hypothetical protein PITC_094930 [Penicillium italicum]|uniref:Uncharacterized protein n=1 Tax=Penicillium italicum TaxID=40296 RepID=A0A0A2KNF0_PENIT|nr:hypothetical protein PITC_094930 [Penicillium italicum]